MKSSRLSPFVFFASVSFAAPPPLEQAEDLRLPEGENEIEILLSGKSELRELELRLY